MSDFDGIIVGGGHNGLTCAAYLPRAGLRAAVMERNAKTGGGWANSGSVSAAPGYKAAAVIAGDLGIKLRWDPVPAPSWNRRTVPAW